VKSPECYRLAIWLCPSRRNVQCYLDRWTFHELQVRRGVGLVSGHEGCKACEHKVKLLGETCSSYLRPNPKFWPKSAARLAVGEEPLIGSIVK